MAHKASGLSYKVSKSLYKASGITFKFYHNYSKAKISSMDNTKNKGKAKEF